MACQIESAWNREGRPVDAWLEIACVEFVMPRDATICERPLLINRPRGSTNPRTTVKWINYIGTLDFGGFVDHTGGAALCRRDPALNRLTRYFFFSPDSEFRGETLYIRFRKGNGYRIFSPFFVPTLDPYEFYECHVGLGYSRIVSKFYGIVTDVTIFVPLGETCEIRDI